MHLCFACKKPVLELEGEYSFLDTVGLRENDPALVQGAYGACHLVCLHQSEWGPIWAVHAMQRIGASGQLARLYEDNICFAIAHKELKNVQIVRMDGASWEIRRHMAGALRKTPHGWMLPHKGEFNIHLRGQEGLAAKIHDRLLTKREFPLLELLHDLGLEDKVYCPEALEDGRLRFHPDLQAYWGPEDVSARIKYFQFVPNHIYEAWRQCASKLKILPKR